MKSNERAKRHMGWQGLVAAGLITAICNFTVNTLPAFLAVVAQAMQLSEQQSGFVASAEIGGIALGTILSTTLSPVIERLNWRRSVALGMLVMVVGSLLSAQMTSLVPLLAMRLMSGIGAGIALAVVYASFAETEASRAMGLANAAQSGIGAFAIPFFTPLTQHFGNNAPFLVMAVLGVVAMVLGFVLPARSARQTETHAHAEVTAESISAPGWVAVASVFVFFLGAGGIFAYMSFMGTAWGNTDGEVEGALSCMLYAAMSAALLVGVLGSRFGFLKPLLGGFAGIGGAALVMAFMKPHAHLWLVASLYGFSMAFIMPYHFEAVTKADRSSSAAMLVSAATLGGYAIGPTLATYLVTPDFEQMNLVGLAAFVLSLLMVFAAVGLSKSGSRSTKIRQMPAVRRTA